MKREIFLISLFSITVLDKKKSKIEYVDDCKQFPLNWKKKQIKIVHLLHKKILPSSARAIAIFLIHLR